MPVTIKVNGTNLSLVHKFSNGISTATIPDICKTPTPGGPVPIPYPNIAQSITLSSGTTTVKGDKAMAANKGSKFSLSNGDNAGTIGGVKSNVFMKEATWLLYSFDVKMDSKNSCRLTDPMYHNSENTVNLAGVCLSPVVVKAIGQEAADELCALMCEARQKKDAGELPDGKLQNYVANQLSSGHPFYTPNKLGTLVEMTWEIPSKSGGVFGAVLSTTRRILANGRLAQRMFWGALSRGRIVDTFRPDITILTNPRNACRWDNVKAFVEMKFKDDPNPNLTDNQARAKARAGKKMVVLKESDCACT